MSGNTFERNFQRADVVEGRLFFIADGITGRMSLPVSYAAMNFIVGLIFFEICILPLQYEFRYSLVCRYFIVFRIVQITVFLQ